MKKTPKKKPGGKRLGGKTALVAEPAEIVAKVESLAEPLCDAEGVELVHVAYHRGQGGRTLRLYVDRPGGIRLDDCAAISRQLGDLMDVYLDHEAAYNLEVSSPGPDRPLGKKDDYNRFEGQKASVRTDEPIDGEKKFKGVLLGLTEGRVNLRIGEKTVAIPFNLIKNARLVNYQGE